MNDEEALNPHHHHRGKKVIVWRDESGHHRWHEVASNGKIVDNGGQPFDGGLEKATERAIHALDLKDGDYTVTQGVDKEGHPQNVVHITRGVD